MFCSLLMIPIMYILLSLASPSIIMFILKAIKSHFKGSYDKQNLTLEVISFEIYETREDSFHKFHMK